MEAQPLHRTAAYESDFGIWKFNYRSKEMLGRLYSLYTEALNDPGHESISIVSGDAHEGVLYYFDEEIEPEEPSYLMDWMRDTLLSSGYELYLSDLIDYNGERRERHYLKPVPGMEPGFGNISIELIVRREQPEYLKLLCTHPQHLMGQAEKGIHDLLHELLSAYA